MNSNAAIHVIDYGVNNLFNLLSALRSLDIPVHTTQNPADLSSAKRVLLPGVGAFEAGIKGLEYLGFVQPLRELAQQNIPLMGICLGMQLLMEESEENGKWNGLGLIPGSVVRLKETGADGGKVKVPHVGWNSIENATADPCWKSTPLQSVKPLSSFYFVHSYHVAPTMPADVLAYTQYGENRFASVVQRGSVFGCQFHPERSDRCGLELLRNFALL